MYNTRPNMSPRGAPKAQYKHKGNAAAVAWWDNHVMRTHMRNPPATPGRKASIAGVNFKGQDVL